MASNSQRQFIDCIRRQKFGIGSTQCNPLAGMLHEAIVHLSAELYQKDIHFISELLQNAEDNVYGRGVSPSLEMVLTGDDITKVGAQATLVLFNNEVGFQPAHVEALCAVGLSTKKGKRDSGYIGEKGIGFKSVFLATRTPYIISNGYRFRFTDEANHEAKIGYVVPEWTDIPTDADLRRVYGKQNLPQTMIILPLRPDKIEPVRQQLKQVSPETLLFLSKLRQLVVREESRNSLCITRSDISAATKTEDERCKVATVNLSVGSHGTHVSEECNYQLLQHQFPVTHRVEQRKEVDIWDITIAFPLLDRINPGHSSGDIYAFLPSYLTSGFPFVINADFLLVSSRETLKFDSPWNKGILSCVPTAFLSAFRYFLQNSSTSRVRLTVDPAVPVRKAYRYIPVQQPQHMELRKVQQVVLDLLKHEDCVLVDSLAGLPLKASAAAAGVRNVFCKSERARLIRSEFRSILEAANAESNLTPAISNLRWYVVDREVQETYRPTLQSLGVAHMTEQEYIECIAHEGWLLSLSEELYWEVVCFVLDSCRSSSASPMETVPILKYCKEDGSIVLASVQEAKSTNGVKICLSPLKKGEWLSKWTSVFKPWASVLFMPPNTVRVLQKFKKQKSNSIMSVVLWQFLISVVPDLSIEKYLVHLLELLATANDPKFVILTTEFAYQCVQENDIELKDVCKHYPRNFPIINQSGHITLFRRDVIHNTRILLPAHGSFWPQLSLLSWSSGLVVLSDDYVKTPSAWSSRLKGYISAKEGNLDLEPFRSYLRSIMGALDIPEIVPPDDASYSIPAQLSSNMTIEQVGLLLHWLTTYRKTRPATSRTSCFFQNLKDSPWLPTEGHGRRQPSSCFEKSSFRAFFKSSDVPFVEPSLSAFGPTLADLGVITDSGKGCETVVKYMLEISDDTTQQTYSCYLEQATRLYTYLHKFLWRPAATSEKLKIFVPGGTSNSSNAWFESQYCVVYKDDGFFNNSLPVLEGLYDSNLLPFFKNVLHVPPHATVERYCQLWLKWRTDVHEITADECTRVWKIVTEKRKTCDANVWNEFVEKAWVPLQSEVTGAFWLSSPSTCFIPDDLHLLSLFETIPEVHFVWYPCNTEQMECAMNDVYVEMGVKKLTDCVQAEFAVGDESGRQVFIENRRVYGAGNGILCPGLFRAILGFIARKKYGLSSSRRQSLLVSLKAVPQITITRPLARRYLISCISPPVMVSQDNVMALWSKKDGKLYCLDKSNPILETPLDRREFHVQLATTISLGLLSEHPLIADDLTEFIIGLLDCGFEKSHVEYELRRKNAKLYEEDEIFLSQYQM